MGKRLNKIRQITGASLFILAVPALILGVVLVVGAFALLAREETKDA